MKISEAWLREWINPSFNSEELAKKLTMAGLEVEAIEPAAKVFSGVRVAEVVKIDPHPTADRLRICTITVGNGPLLSIVCGASNVHVGMKVAAALKGAELPNTPLIEENEIRGVLSNGMLCSAKELGLSEEGEGLLALSSDLKLGDDLWSALTLNDHVFELSITPNRGDCLSVRGIAHEVSALTNNLVTQPTRSVISPTITDSLSVFIENPAECPRYVGRIIRQVNTHTITPFWIQERLRRCGLRSINSIVDIMNYVMLEIGQPMHAFDLSQLTGNVTVRLATSSEQLQLLNGESRPLSPETLIIADDKKPLAIAGVMGGWDSRVSYDTTDIFLESAFFSPIAIARVGRQHHLGSDSSYRFERGVDPTIQALAIERATQLLLDIVGGHAGPVIENSNEHFLPKEAIISLRKSKVDDLLGFTISENEIISFFERLNCPYKETIDGWLVTVSPRRSDIKIDVDLIEEIIRLYGYDNLPAKKAMGVLLGKAELSTDRVANFNQSREVLIQAGYNEVITYSFIDKVTQHLFDPLQKPKTLLNPLTSEMSVMRTSLWPGLIQTLLYNQARQQTPIRLFETGLRFITLEDDSLLQQPMLAGLVSGNIVPLQWGETSRPVDFFDIKGDLENIFACTLAADEFTFEKGEHPALHPGQSAQLFRNKNPIGYVGALHPKIIQQKGIVGKVYLFELILDGVLTKRTPEMQEISKFPLIRRDIAILVNQTVPTQLIQDTIISVGGKLLKEVTLFDVYQGKDMAVGSKSLALSLILQHSSRTLIDEEVNEVIEKVIVALNERFAAELRG